MGLSRVGALAAPVRLRSENRGAAAQVDDGIASGKIMRYDYAILYNHFVTPQLLEIYIIVEYQLTLSNKIPQPWLKFKPWIPSCGIGGAVG